VARRAGYRAAAGTAALALAVVTVAYAPFLLWSTRGVGDSIAVQLFRSLEIESLGGALYAATHRVLGIPLLEQRYYYDFPSDSAQVVAMVSAAAGLFLVAALWIAHARASVSPSSLVRYSAATVAAFIAFGKVLSPQYLLWLIPLVPLVGGLRGRVATGLLGLACLLTAVVFPSQWDPALLVQLAAAPLVIVVIRNLLLVGLLVVLAWPAGAEHGGRRHSERPRSACPAP
jgi:hypothetical protein